MGEKFMDEQFLYPITASLVAALVTTIGIAVVQRHESWGRQNSSYFAAFAAGVLITVSFLHLIPKSFDLLEAAPVYLLTGYLVMHVLNRFITAYVCDRPSRADFAIGLVPMLGIGFHSLIDGVVYSITFTVSTFTGVAAAIGMVLHEFPEGIVTYVLLLRSGIGRRWAFWLAFVSAALSTPLGTLISYPFVHQVDRSVLGSLLSLSAGALIYVGATHLLPAAEREARRYSLLALGAGIATAIGITVFH
jgi:zinc transporter ZupT